MKIGFNNFTEVSKTFDNFRALKSKFDEENKSHLLNSSTVSNIAYIIKSFNYLSSYIFTSFVNSYPDNLNKPISSDYIMEITQNMCNKLSIDKKITPHSFRKSFIEISLNKNETSQMIRYYDFRDKVKNNAIHGFGDIF